MVAKPVYFNPSAFEWEEHAACRKEDREEFFPAHGNRSTAAAKVVCRRCPVRSPCLDWALRIKEPNGIWGGMTRRERDAEARRRAAAAGPDRAG